MEGKFRPDEKQKSSEKVTLTEALLAIAASCSSAGVLLQIILLVLFFKVYNRFRNYSAINHAEKEENVAMVKISTPRD